MVGAKGLPPPRPPPPPPPTCLANHSHAPDHRAVGRVSKGARIVLQGVVLHDSHQTPRHPHPYSDLSQGDDSPWTNTTRTASPGVRVCLCFNFEWVDDVLAAVDEGHSNALQLAPPHRHPTATLGPLRHPSAVLPLHDGGPPCVFALERAGSRPTDTTPNTRTAFRPSRTGPASSPANLFTPTRYWPGRDAISSNASSWHTWPR